MLKKFVAFTHSEYYLSFIIHFPVAFGIVVAFHSLWAFVFAATIGLWKDMWLDVKYGSTTVLKGIAAELYYFAGACIGMLVVAK